MKTRESVLSMESAALTVTFLAHLGHHQEIHYQIANIAMLVEGVSIASAAAAIMTREKHPEASRIFGQIAIAGVTATVAAFAAVPATDDEYGKFFTSEEAMNPETYAKIMGMWAADAWRDTVYGFNVAVDYLKHIR